MYINSTNSNREHRLRQRDMNKNNKKNKYNITARVIIASSENECMVINSPVSSGNTKNKTINKIN